MNVQRPNAPTPGEERADPPWGKLIVIVCAIAALAAAWRFTPLAGLVTADHITQWARDFASSPWAPIVVLAAYTPACLIMFPRSLITLFAVLVFGPWQGFFYAMSGILVAAFATYCAGRVVDRSTVRKIAGSRLNRVSEILSKRGLLAVTAVRLVPVAPFFVISMVAGAIRIKVWHFALGTAIGMLPGTLAATLFADQLEIALRSPADVNYWLIAGIVLFLTCGMLLVRKVFFEQSPRKPAKLVRSTRH